ncbi:4-alpha-glucanotransferase [Corynebacterium deserti GIMN1.010]|uniref:4-alpha-glucanotransferase n=1 Tax=Corynebacterium deserti GIMN1.010 TaxID=931089 RepID=A0A0M4CJE4_9CORY|nr:4-alpha-glucanotransferase [Corynebacterium deserti]ALC06458.1 4-alpha-glucanotransferase [Corynebacterium deserti GIMN1.010]
MTARGSLNELADLYGVATFYTDYKGAHVEVSDDTLVKILRALGVDLGTPTEAEIPSDEVFNAAIQRFHDREFSRPLPPSVVAVEGDEYVFPVHVHDGAPAEVHIELEDGTRREVTQVENWTPPREIDGITWGEASFKLPGDLPLGWHTLHLASEDMSGELAFSCGLIITPARLSTADKYLTSPRTGVMAQIYSVRSTLSWGMGDFNDLGKLAATVAQDGADFLLINPMHAAEPLPPTEDSPYLPTTRRFINPIYIRVEDVPEFNQLDVELRDDVAELAEEFRERNLTSDIIERNDVYTAKLQVLHAIFELPRTPEREASFVDFVQREGQGLIDFATWCADREISQYDAVHAALPDRDELTMFYMWLQWLCDEQLEAAQARAIDAGMSIGIMADLAVGVHPGGADAQNLSHVLAPDASVGAPPDGYNQQGQDWSQPPWNPVRLAEEGYIPWRNLLRTVLRHSGGIRVDHVLGLFRLFVMPRMKSPATGTYVRFDHDALVGILALEAELANAVVIGEDLGTFEPWVQDALAQRGIMGTSILWFEHSPNHPGPRHQDEYRPLALTSVTTHDLPPTAAYLEGEHIKLRERLGVLTTDPADEDAEDLQWQAEILDTVANTGALPSREYVGLPRNERGELSELMEGLHAFVAGTPSALTCVSLVDMVGDKRAQNQPGTTKDLYPNWCIPLCDTSGKPVTIETLRDHDLYHKIAQASRRA